MTITDEPVGRSFDDLFIPRMLRTLGRREGTHTAAVQDASAIPRRQLGRWEPWQAKVRGFDRDGPGFVGFYLDIKALVASLIPLHVEEMGVSGKWGPSENPTAAAALTSIRGVTCEQGGLVFSQFRSLDSVGEYWLAAIDVPTEGVRWMVAQTPQLTFEGGDRVILRTRRDAVPSDTDGVYVLGRHQLRRCWHHDDDWPGEAHSSLRRSIPDIEYYRSVTRNMRRTVDSRILTNGIVWFAPHDPTKMPMQGPDTKVQTVDRVIEDYARVSHRALTEDQDFAAFVPFPTSGEKPPQFVDVGRMLDPHVLEAKRDALESFGRDVNIPMRWLTEGPGAGNQWSDLILQEDFLRTGVAPGLGEVCDNTTTAAFRPIFEVLRAAGHDLDDPKRYRVWYDY